MNDDRREFVFLSVGFGIVFLVFVLVLATSSQAGVSVASSAVLLSFFATVVSVRAMTCGRSRFTPTGILRVPMLGRPKWVLFEDVQRFRMGKHHLVLDIGRNITVPWNRMSYAVRDSRAAADQLRGWLAHYFDVDVSPRTWSWTAKRVLLGTVTFGFIVAQPFLSERVRQLLVPIASQFSANASPYAKAVFMFGVGMVPAVLWFGLFYATFRVGDRVLGLGLFKARGWHYRRQAGHGFEVRVAEPR